MRRVLDFFGDNPSEVRQRYESNISPSLVSAKLKLVDACNLRCFMCSYWKKTQKGDLDTEEVKKVLLGLSKLSCKKIHFTGGEIFIRKDALELMEYTHKLGMRVTLTTNGTLPSKETLKALLRIPARSITLSIDAPNSKLHDSIRGQKNAFKKTMKTLAYLAEHRKAKNKIRINTVVNQLNYTHLPELAHLLSSFSIDSWLLIPMDAWVDKDNMMNESDINRYTSIIAPLLEEIVTTPDFSPWIYGQSTHDLQNSVQQHYARGYYKTKPCFIPWFHVLVGPKGDVYPCCGTHRLIKPLGNVREHDIFDLFNSESYQQFRQQMRTERLLQCHNCDDFLKENKTLDALMRTST